MQSQPSAPPSNPGRIKARSALILALLILALPLVRAAVAVTAAQNLFLPVVLTPRAAETSKFGEVLQIIDGPTHHHQGLAWDGAGLWVVGAGIHRVDPETGALLNSIPEPAPDIQDITWDGTSLWAVSYQTDTVYQLSPSDGQVLSSFDTPAEKSAGLAWDGSSLWLSAENGRLYKVDPATGAAQSEQQSPRGGTVMLAWDGSHLWFSGYGGSMIEQFEITTWRKSRAVDAKAEGSKGIVWVDGKLWNAGFDDEQIYLIDVTPGGAPVSSRVLKNGVPLPGKFVEMWDVDDQENEVMAAGGYTDANGEVLFDLDHFTHYEYRGFGDMQNNEMGEWVRQVFTEDGSLGTIQLPEVDVVSPSLLEPAADATFNISSISATNPVEFRWSSKDGAIVYWAHMRNRDTFKLAWRGTNSPATSDAFDGITEDGTLITPGRYFWYVGMELPGRWWAWSSERIIQFVP